MNITCDIFTNESNCFNSLDCNDNKNIIVFQMVVQILTFLLSFPTNSYVIWLIVTGTGNGLVPEFFILNFSVCEIFYCIQCLLAFLGYNFEIIWIAVIFLDGFPTTGRPLFESLICVERYLAVVHPVTFLKYKPLRYKLMCSAVAWVICFGSCIFYLMIYFFLGQIRLIAFLAQFLIFLSFQLFCCLAVLRALKQSGPGERGREKEEKNNMKRRAFNLILITTVTRVVFNAPQITLPFFGLIQDDSKLSTFVYVFYLFAGLVQPDLFLYRVGKLNFLSIILKKIKFKTSL